jgi:hypothetical protein
MKPHNGDTGFALGFSISRIMRPLRIMAIAFLLLSLPVGASTGHATTASVSGAHVYLVRGIFNVFSLGMDEIAAKLQQQGITATVHNHLSWASIADDAVAEYKSGQARIIVLVGHSSGATVLPGIVERMTEKGVPVKLAIGLDSVFRTSLAGKVGRYINFYIANGAGTPVAPTKDLRGKLENVDVQKIPGIGHISIDKNEIMQRKVISAIDAVVLNRPQEAAATQKPPEVSAAKPGSSTASAAAVVPSR